MCFSRNLPATSRNEYAAKRHPASTPIGNITENRDRTFPALKWKERHRMIVGEGATSYRRVLLERGADPNLAPPGETTLRAARAESLRKLLRDYGARDSLEDDRHLTEFRMEVALEVRLKA